MVNTNLDTTPLPPNNLVAQDPQSAELAGYVRTKTFGREVREAIARSIELNSTRSKSAEILASETVNVANDLTDRFNQQIGALTEDSEVIDARGGKDTLGQRLDDNDTQLTQIGDFTKQIDYVKMLREHNHSLSKLKARITGNGKFEVVVPFKGEKSAIYSFIKDTNDDFIKFDYGGIKDFGEYEIDRVNYTSKTGVFNTDYPPLYYTTQIGATISGTFKGTGVDFVSRTNNDGGIWEIVIDGDESTKKTISTWSATEINNVPHQVVRGLVEGTHTIVATFKGDDPAHPPISGTSRGWVNFKTEGNHPQTFIVYSVTQVDPHVIFSKGSNKEFAIGARATGSGHDYVFFPDHGQGGMFIVTQRLFFDDVRKTNWVPQVDYTEVSSVSLVQKAYFRHPQSPTVNLAEITIIHTINDLGVSIKGSIKFLVASDLAEAYTIMAPVQREFAKRLITSFGTRYELDKSDLSRTDLIEDDQAISYAFVNDSGFDDANNYVGAVTINDIKNTFRQGKSNQKQPSVVQIQHRDDIMQKLYSQVYAVGTQVQQGEIIKFDATFAVGEIQFANDIF